MRNHSTSFQTNPGLKVVGYPTRPDLEKWTKQTALDHFGFTPDLPILLVTGGSSGARSINRALMRALPELIEEMQIIHITGNLDWDEIVQTQKDLEVSYPQMQSYSARYRAFPYIHDEMGAAFTAADLVITRAGASTLGELPLFGLPAILVPYPYAWHYQQVNAEFLTRHGAAEIMLDRELPGELSGIVRTLIRDKVKLASMRKGMSALSQPDAASEMAKMLIKIAAEESPKRKKP